MGILAMVVGVAMFSFGVWTWHVRWAMEDTPTSDAAHVFPGINEIHGVVTAVTDAIVSPLSGRTFVHWNYKLEKRVQRGKSTSWDDVEAGSAWTPCWLSDASGRVPLDPDGATVMGDVDTRWSDSLLGVPLPDVTLQDLRSCATPDRAYRGGFLDHLFGDDPASTSLADLRGTFRVTESGLSNGAEVFGTGTGAWDDRAGGVVLGKPMKLRPGNEEAARTEAGLYAVGGVVLGSVALVGGPLIGPDPSPALAAAAIVAAVVVFGATYALRVYNRVVRATTQRDKAAAMIDVELEHRAALVPQLVVVVRSAFTHERELLGMLTAARTDATADLGPLLGRLEATPSLSTNVVAARLRSELVRCENRLAFARRYRAEAEQVLADRTTKIPDRWFVPLTSSARTRARAAASVPSNG